MTRRLLTLLITGALVLAACGSDDAPVGEPRDASPDDPVSSPEPGDKELPGVGGPELVEPRPGMDNPHPSAFTSVEPIGDERTLAVFFTGGVAPCYVLDRVEIDETDTTVTITLFIGADPEAVTDTETVACIDIGVSYETRVTLDAPLGARTIVDGSLS